MFLHYASIVPNALNTVLEVPKVQVVVPLKTANKERIVVKCQNCLELFFSPKLE